MGDESKNEVAKDVNKCDECGEIPEALEEEATKDNEPVKKSNVETEEISKQESD